jgi:methylenetetrahydrofolate reductase (NADPH)
MTGSAPQPPTSHGSAPSASSTPAAQALASARLEVIPTRGILDDLRAHSPVHRTVTITASESLGLEATLSLACTLRADGRTVIPHVAARMVAGRTHLREIVDRLAAAGIDTLFVPGGDATPGPGAYTSSLELLEDLAQLDHPFTTVGVAADPEPHPTIPEAVVTRALAAKHMFATEMVSNLCFDPDTVRDWVGRIRREGVTLPLRLGVPGRVDAARLARVGARIGVGQSLRFVRGKAGTVARLLTPGGFAAQRLVDRMGGLLADPAAGIAGLHVYTFNEIERTEAWLASGED